MQAVKLVAGRELDALVAEKVMDLQPCSDPVGRCEAAHMTPCQCWGTGRGGSDLWPYSTDIAAAWQVVEKMDDGIELTRWYTKPGAWVYTATFGGWSVDAETAPLAICRAALIAVDH